MYDAENHEFNEKNEKSGGDIFFTFFRSAEFSRTAPSKVRVFPWPGMQPPAPERGRYPSGSVVAVTAVVVLALSLFVAERRAGGGVDPHWRNNPRLTQALGELIEDARGMTTGRGVYTEVGSRERIDRLEQSAKQGVGRRGTRPSSSGLPVCAEDLDCHYPRGACDIEEGVCRCVVAYAGLRCDRVVHAGFPISGVYGRMLPLDVLDEGERDLYGIWTDEEDDKGGDGDRLYPVERVSERCVVRPGTAEAVAVRWSGVGREIERRLVERFGAREMRGGEELLENKANKGNKESKESKESKGNKEHADALGDVVVLLEAMRRCLAVEVDAQAGETGGNEAIRWLMARLTDV